MMENLSLNPPTDCIEYQYGSCEEHNPVARIIKNYDSAHQSHFDPTATPRKPDRNLPLIDLNNHFLQDVGTQNVATSVNIPAIPSITSSFVAKDPQQVILARIATTPTPGARRLTKVFTPTTCRSAKQAFQVHHVIPRSIWNVYFFPLRNLQLYMNKGYNLVTLPTGKLLPPALEDVSTPSAPRMTLGERYVISSRHWGSHKKQYMDDIRTTLQNIFRTIPPKPTQVTIAFARQQLLDFIGKTKEGLLDGTLPLN